MKLLTSFFFLALILLATACSKENLIDQATEAPTIVQEVSVQNGMLVFESEKSFDAALEKTNKMGDAEKKEWEENLGFKSFDRTVSEVMAEQREYEKKFEDYTSEELENLLESGDNEQYSPSTKKYIDKGIIKIVVDENNERNLDINYPMYASLVNIDGFVAVENEILQYSENKFKLIKSLDFSKLNKINSMKENVDNETFFVTDIHSREKVTAGKVFEYSAESYTYDRKKIVATETFQYYDRYHDGVHYEANYTIKFVNQVKWLFLWSNQEAQVWVWGNFDIEPGTNIPFVKEHLSFSYPDMYVYSKEITVLKRQFINDYLHPDKNSPKILNSTWNFVRTGGPHGLGVRLIDHVRYERF